MGSEGKVEFGRGLSNFANMASVWIEKRKQGYVVRWRHLGVKHASAAYLSKGEAVAAADELDLRLGRTLRKRKNGPRARANLTLEQLATSWQAERGMGDRPGQRHYGQAVVDTVKRLADELGWLTANDVNLESLRRWKQERKGGVRQLAYLRTVLRWASAAMDQPLDIRVDRALRAPQGQEADLQPYTAEQTQQVLDLAGLLGQGAIISCLATYGWRPITACRITCGDLRADGTIRIGIKRNGPWIHPIFPHHIAELGKLAHGRGADEPLFFSTANRPWRTGQAAHELSRWYRDNLHPAEAQGNIYQLKRFAITRMHRGLAPWARPLSIAEIQLFTGHRSKNQVLRYIKAHLDEARGVMGHLPPVGSSGADGAIGDQNPPPGTPRPQAEVLIFPRSSG